MANLISDIGSIESAKEKWMREGKSLFNQNAFEGIKFLVRRQMIGDDPEEIARFLLNDDLNQDQIVKFLMSNENGLVLRYFIRQFSFEGKTAADSIRIAFGNIFSMEFNKKKIFESKHLEKFIKELSLYYSEQNQQDPGQMETFFNCLMISNATQQGKKDKSHMAKYQFENGAKFDKDMVEENYEDIIQNPIWSPKDVLQEHYKDLKKEGYLSIKPTKLGAWESRYSFLTSSRLILYDQKTQVKNIYLLKHLSVKSKKDRFVRLTPLGNHLIECVREVKNESDSINLTRVKLRAEDTQNAKDWCDAITRVITDLLFPNKPPSMSRHSSLSSNDLFE